ncbi:hypothetical protein CWM66_10495 [Kosakonia sp. H7A]|nr:hypothetical protein CWM66_10495 [Kosakonia sp. H7A]QJT81311.1 hypothetical protein C0557_15110 [Kosakonia sp. MUSA4]
MRDKDKLADVMDYPAFTLSICLTKSAVFMCYIAEFMYRITVILRCDAALLWRINFPLKLLPAQVSRDARTLMPCFINF